MTVIPLRAFTDNYIWIIPHTSEASFTCVDPGDATPVLAYAKKTGLNLAHMLITHHHADHIGGITALLNAFPQSTVYAPDDDRIPLIHHRVRDKDIVSIDTLTFQVLSIPGHTNTHIAYQEPREAWLFCGDTLFSAGCGRVFDGTIKQLHHSIALLKNLPDDTAVYCAHEYTQKNLRFAKLVEPNNQAVQTYLKHLQQQSTACSLPSTIGFEKTINPFMRTHLPAVQAFAALELGQTLQSVEHIPESLDDLTVFQVLRARKDRMY